MSKSDMSNMIKIRIGHGGAYSLQIANHFIQSVIVSP